MSASSKARLDDNDFYGWVSTLVHSAQAKGQYELEPSQVKEAVLSLHRWANTMRPSAKDKSPKGKTCGRTFGGFLAITLYSNSGLRVTGSDALGTLMSNWAGDPPYDSFWQEAQEQCGLDLKYLSRTYTKANYYAGVFEELSNRQVSEETGDDRTDDVGSEAPSVGQSAMSTVGSQKGMSTETFLTFVMSSKV
jgi:hypothetical protein